LSGNNHFIGSVLAIIAAAAIFAAFFFLLRWGVNRARARRFWRIGVFVYVPLALVLVIATALEGEWFQAAVQTVLGIIVLASVYRLLQRPET
jgi:NADH:ubiquinone oxidoreductase subunit H